LTPEQIQAVVGEALASIAEADSADALEQVRIKYLGKKGEVSLLLRGLGKVPAEDRPAMGQAINAAKNKVQSAFDAKKKNFGSGKQKKSATLDVTLPGIRHQAGHRHPLMATMHRLKTILQGMGFHYDDYPEVEDEFHNFDSLNTPVWHPARDMHDSFYTKDGNLLRTHTTAFQNRAMKKLGEPPIRAMTAGRCYRNDEIDATHFPIFNQLDVIAIDRGISFADLKWTLREVLKALFGQEMKLQFRPSYFPFTTPSAEVDVFYRGRWMELLGSGMIRPEVLRDGGIDPDQWQGFAFGIGIDRLTMARHDIHDIRLLYENDEAFLKQF
jgi:phenylalanyl-tRNA synthetase alpha chain